MEQRESRKSRRGRARLGLYLLGAGLALAGLSGLFWVANCAPSRTGPGPDQPQWLNLDPSVQYVGRDACRECHLDIYSTFVETGMGRAFYPMNEEVEVEDFEERNEIVDPRTGLHYRMLQRDGRYYQQQFVVDAAGRQIALDEHELKWALGSNNHNRSYVLVIDDRLFQAPVCWYPQGERWDLCPGYETDNLHFYREISESCVSCHNGRMELAEGFRNKYEEPLPHGIGCERCHGPGQLHVARWSNGNETPTGNIDPTIVQPRRLPPSERLDICLNCHLGDARATERVIRPNVARSTFAPGKRLTDVVVPIRFRQSTQHDFGLSAQADRMMLSRCYTESGGKLECLTCHNPHVTVYHPDRPRDLYRNRCVSCHTTEACTAPAERRRATEGLADDCVACHMRRAEPDDQKHTLFTDHWIRREIHVEKRDPRTDLTLEPVFPGEFAALPAAERPFFEARANFLMSKDVEGEPRESMLAVSARQFEASIDAGYDTVDAWFFLGKVRQRLGQRTLALDAFRKAHERDPAHHDAAFALGQALVTEQKLKEALAIFLELLERDPRNVMAMAEAGRTHMSLGQLELALEHYDRALGLEPWNASLHLNLGMLLAATGRFEEAERAGETALRLNPDDPEVWEFYEKIKRARGDEAEADRARDLLVHFRRVEAAS